MKRSVKVFLSAVIVSTVVFSASAQINIDGGIINIRNNNNPYQYTYHYGDFWAVGGVAGTGWGWVNANRLTSNGYAYVNGNLDVGGTVSASVKNFIHPHPTDESQIIRYISIESGEALTLARGTAKTVNGEVTVKLPEHFSMTTSPNAPVTVTFSPEGAPVVLYTKQKSKEQIVIAMKKSDLTAFGDVEFAFQVTGVRDGFENVDVFVDAKSFYSPGFKDKWEDTEVGVRIKAQNDRVRLWQEEEMREKYKDVPSVPTEK